MSSADSLRELLAAAADTRAMYLSEALYHMQVEYTCRLLDVVDEETDPATAKAVTVKVFQLLAGDAATAASERIIAKQDEIRRLQQEASRPPRLPTWRTS